MNVDRLVCGMATVFDVERRDGIAPSPSGRKTLGADDFRRFVNAGLTCPLMLNHDLVLQHHGAVRTIGTVRRFHILEGYSAGIPDGLLCLAELDAGPLGYSLLEGMSREQWGMSAAVVDAFDADTWGQGSILSEISLSLNPAFERALVVGTRADALSRWELLTGEVLAGVTAR